MSRRGYGQPVSAPEPRGGLLCAANREALLRMSKGELRKLFTDLCREFLKMEGEIKRKAERIDELELEAARGQIRRNISELHEIVDRLEQRGLFGEADAGRVKRRIDRAEGGEV